MGSNTVQTTYGKLELTPLSGDVIYVDANENCGSDPSIGLIVNRVRYGIAAHLLRGSDRSFRMKYFNMSKPNAPYNKSMPSASAKRKAWAAIEKAVNEWADKNKQALIEADIYDCQREMKRIDEELKQLNQKIHGLEEQKKSLASRCRELMQTRSNVCH